MMATADDYAAWIVANESKKGTPEFATVAAAYREAKGDKPARASAEILGGISPAGSMFENLAAGFGKALVDVGRGVGQITGLMDQSSIDEAKRLDAPLMDTGAGLTGNIAGNLATMFGPGAAVGAAGKAMQAKRMVDAARAFLAPKTALGGAGIGAGMASIQPVASDESRGINVGIGAVGGGVGTAAANALGRALGPKAASIQPAQSDLIAKAQGLGYQLKPSEISGKRWQQNLEAAMAQMPTTAGRMQEIGAANQGTTNKLVESALAHLGGSIDQPSAGASALEGWKQGMGAEGDRLGAAYRGLLQGVDVPLENARPTLEALRAKQMELPATSQSGAGMAALSDLLGSPGYTGPAARAGASVRLDPNKDDIVTAIRKLGGITPGDEAIGSLAKHYQFAPDPRFGPVWRNAKGNGATGTTAGHSLDRMAELLHDSGYLSDRNALPELMSKIEDHAMGGGQHFSLYRTPENVDSLAGAIEKLVGELGAKRAPAAARGGYIRDKQTVPGEVAQALRSDFTQASSAESTGRDRVLFGKMKTAIDEAIDSALPEASRGTFGAINRRYGIYAGLNAISPKQQNVFLNQLYRGSDSPDQFFTFLGMAPEGSFKDVARGFASKLVTGATEEGTGNISAVRLGASIKKANPDALKYFGGQSGEVLRDVGNIGRDVLREQTPNSGTGQRLMYQGLLTGSGLGLGGYFGSSGGSPGAVAGSAVGAFALPKAMQAAYLSKALRPLLTTGTKGRAAVLDEEMIKRLAPFLGRASTAGILGLLGSAQ